MTTMVVNEHHLKEADRRSPDYVYIGRAGKGQDGYFGNPIIVGLLCPVCGRTHSEPASTLHCFKEYFDWRMREDAEYKRRVDGLKGKMLSCFCAPRPCHGFVYWEYLEGKKRLDAFGRQVLR